MTPTVDDAQPIGSVPGKAIACLNVRAAQRTLLLGVRAALGSAASDDERLVGDAYGEWWAGTGSWRGSWLLLVHPVRSDREVIEGRWIDYVTSVKLILMCSVLYFLAQAGAPLPDFGASFDLGFGVGVGELPLPARPCSQRQSPGGGES